MHVPFTTIGYAFITGLLFLGLVSASFAAEDQKKPAGKSKQESGSASPAKKAPEKKTPDKKAGAKNKSVPSKAVGSPPAKGPAPTYASAQIAASGQACFGDAPRIESISPDEGKPGDKVTITGKNFGSADCIRSLSFGPGHPAVYQLQGENHIKTTVPTGGRKGLAMVTVTTASGEDSKGFLVK
jgi:hypothetical protein